MPRQPTVPRVTPTAPRRKNFRRSIDTGSVPQRLQSSDPITVSENAESK
jgi:hypothetical protein